MPAVLHHGRIIVADENNPNATNMLIQCSWTTAFWLKEQMAEEKHKLGKWLNSARSYRVPKSQRLEKEHAYEALAEALDGMVLSKPKPRLVTPSRE